MKLFNIFKEIKKLRYLAYHDSLTGIYNRNYLDSINYLDYTYLYFIDLNDLKFYNNQSYITGDEFIVSCVDNIKLHLSISDVFIRYGGDEFIILTNSAKFLYTNKMYAIGDTFMYGQFMSDQVVRDFDYYINLAHIDMVKNKTKWKECILIKNNK